jgi:hypothetical protein
MSRAAAPAASRRTSSIPALRYRAQAPLVDQLLKEIGVQGGDVGSVAQGLLAGAAAGEAGEAARMPVIGSDSAGG